MEGKQLEEQLTLRGFSTFFYDGSRESASSVRSPATQEAEQYASFFKSFFIVHSDSRDRFKRMKATQASLKFLIENCLGGSSREDVKRENDRQLDSLTKISKLVVLVHGLTLDIAPFLTFDSRAHKVLRKQLEFEGYNSVSLEYDDRAPFKEYSAAISEQLKELIKKVPCTRNTFGLGHSTGADILRYIFNRGSQDTLLNDIGGLLFSAPCTNGKPRDIGDKIFFGKKADYCDPNIKEGQEIIPLLQMPMHQKGLTIACLNDVFAPLRSALDTRGKNLVVNHFGHLSGIGYDPRFNQIYIAAIKYFN